MGQLHVALASAAGAKVIALDRVPFRLERARELGAFAAVDVDAVDAKTAVADLTAGEMADVVIVGPGSIAAMETGVALAGSCGRVVLFTTGAPDATLTVSPFELYFAEVSLVPSYSCGPDDTKEALDHIRRGTVPIEKLVTHRFPLDDIAEAMRAAADVDRALKTLIVFD
jgi:L-iditol 2-dehydrogenase